MQATLIGICFVVLACYMVSIKFDETPSVDCYRSIAERFPQLVGGVSVASMTKDELVQKIEPALGSTIQLRTTYRIREVYEKQGRYDNQQVLSMSVKVVIPVLVFVAIVAVSDLNSWKQTNRRRLYMKARSPEN
jgi:hypothetical protein